MARSAPWKLQDAKARFSELVRRARTGEPQHVTVHGKEAVVVVDPQRFEIRAKPPQDETLAGFVERSKKYRGAAEGIQFERKSGMTFRDKRREIFDEELFDKGET
jgi:prevent-host-death family protein